MPSTRLLLVAHAATDATRRAIFPTGEEAPDPRDLAAATACRGRLPPRLEALVAPAPAAQETAEALGLHAATCEPALRDLDVGAWKGQPLAAVAAEALGAWRSDPGFADHGGESLAALVARIVALLGDGIAAPGTVVAVTHAAVLRAAVVAALGAPAAAFWAIDAPPLAVLTLHSDGRRWALRGLAPLAAALSASLG